MVVWIEHTHENVASVVSGTPWNQAKKWRMKASQYFVTLDLILSNACQDVWSLHSHSACSQVSVLLFYAWTAKFMWAQICVGDMHVSHLQAKGQQHHLS